MAQETLNEATALTDIHNISEHTLTTNDYLFNINNNLDNINNNIGLITDYYVIQKIEKEKSDEQKTEKTTKENTEKSNTENTETRTEETIDLEDVYQEILICNSHLETQNNLLIVSDFSIGLILGVVLISLFWQRFFK